MFTVLKLKKKLNECKVKFIKDNKCRWCYNNLLDTMLENLRATLKKQAFMIWKTLIVDLCFFRHNQYIFVKIVTKFVYKDTI